MEHWFQERYRVVVNNKSKDFGSTDTKRKIISINKRKAKSTGQKGELLDSIKHEVNHAKHPRKSERAIEQMTAQQKLSKKTKSKLYKLIN